MTQLYVVYDRTAEEAGPIFQAKNDAVASRAFQQLVNQQEYPEDFRLMHVGEFSSEALTGEFFMKPREVVPAVSHADLLDQEAAG